MKRYFTPIIFLLIYCFGPETKGQQLEYNLNSGPWGIDRLTVISSEGNLDNSGVHLGQTTGGNDIISNAPFIATTFAATPINKVLKATAGKPFNVGLSFDLGLPENSSVYVNSNTADLAINGGIGKNEQGYAYDQYITLTKGGGGIGPNSRGVFYGGQFTFPVGRTQGWLVFGFTINRTMNGYTFPPYYYTVVLPYVIEGSMVSLSNPITPLGTFKEPAIPQLILHNPPGDMSTVTFQQGQKTCRNISQQVSTSQSVAGNLNVTLGIAGSAGLFVTTNFEFSATISASAGTGSSAVTSNGRENCIEIMNAISTLPGLPANEGSIYMGYSSDIAYGVYPTVSIRSGPTISVVKDSALIFATVPNSAAPFYYSKSDILNDMRLKQNIADTASVEKIKIEALSQVSVWQQVLEKDSLNIRNITNQVITQPFTITGGQGVNQSSTTTTISTSDSYEVSHYIEAGVGASFVISVGGSGVSGGVEFKTNKTVGQTVNVSGGSSMTIAYNLQDDDGSVNGSESDQFRIKIVKDPTYGTPIFLLDSVLSQTSCPYEGGYPRNQPKLEVNGSTSPIVTISNVSLGTSGNFRVKVCNTSSEVRDYGFGFIGESIVNDVSITSTAGIGSSPTGTSITKLATITEVPPNGGCKTTTYDVNISRRNPASPMAYQNIEFVTYAECEPAIKSSIFANIDFAGPLPPTGVAASNGEICSGTPVILTANCPVATTPTWYNVAIGGFPLAIGASVTVNPTANTMYYVGCETTDYKRDRVATQLVLVGSPSTVLNLTTDYTINSLQIANTTLTATNKIINPARVTYKAGNSLTFNPGFEAKSGSNFMARIGGCGN
ncbi:MAG: hypothetical protein ACJAZY_002036 [Spirosomataceae bacterium]|jgi:hypothetical protein